MGAEQRRDERYSVKIPARLILGHDVASLVTEDVSFRGLFLRTDSPPKLRQLVRVELDLPNGNVFASHGMAVHIVPTHHDGAPAQRRVAGVGVQFYAMDPARGVIWDAFVKSVRENAPQSAIRLRQPPPQVDAIRRKFPRFKVALEVRFQTVDELYTAYTTDVSRGGLFVKTDRVLTPGTEVALTLVRPDSQASIALDGVVRRQVRTAALSGVGVELTELDDQKRDQLFQFISDSMPTIDDFDLVEEDDRKLA